PVCCPPRPNGLGRQAIEARQPRFVPDRAQNHAEDELARTNPRVYALGIQATAALPLFVGAREGGLYVAFKTAHWFTEEEIRWLQLFANLAEDAVRHVTMYTQMRARARLLSDLHAVAESLVRAPGDPALLDHIAWNTLNILAADVVTIYEY